MKKLYYSKDYNIDNLTDAQNIIKTLIGFNIQTSSKIGYCDMEEQFEIDNILSSFHRKLKEGKIDQACNELFLAGEVILEQLNKRIDNNYNQFNPTNEDYIFQLCRKNIFEKLILWSNHE